MTIIRDTYYDGERPLYGSNDLRLERVTIGDGESGLKESRHVELHNCEFQGMYVLWECEDILCSACHFASSDRAPLWYGKHIRMRDCLMDAPKVFRELDGLHLENLTLTDAAEALAEEMGRDDRGFTVICESAEPSVEMMNAEDSRRVIALLNVAQNGVIEMSRQVAGLVEYSRNLGVIRFEDGKITFVFSTRSSIEERLDASIRELNLLAALTGCKTRHHSRYPGWSYANVSDIRDRYLATYKTVTGREATVNVIHAGLECGVIRSHVPDMDMISIGPDMKDIHSPNEALDLDSVESFWKVLAELIPTL
jgi:hypothetical protein